ncbi:RNA-guided endonuclease InsQ/TnpB family protein [Anoxybacteroides amylolyticum]|uniref:Transposase, IS605 OrfB family n=1 Tax=Anoxybacteroides amylolyticum TaxID=294699 RepID=A0A160F3X3_9BACL|nr:RNA-guided endonuclease TnpB family protein [Anoxybacillus amylolyticus]ANB61026.1 transposase, IS605 OrfB family [Anoxybacillus amylolyticus]
MKKAYFVEIKPTTEQAIKINKTIGVCRYVYNFYISKNKEIYEKEKRFMSGYEFDKWLNNVHIKQQDQWMKDVSTKAVKQSIMNAEKAFQRFFQGKSGFPRYKRKKDQDVNCYFPKNNKTDWTVERHRIKIPTIGWVRLKEYGYIPKNAIVRSGTVSKKAGRYFVSVLCEVEDVKPNVPLQSTGIGIDLGIKAFAVLSDGRVFQNINYTQKIKKLKKKLKREQRSLSRKYENLKKRGEEPAAKRGANIDKNIFRVQKLHARLANIRLEYVKFVANEVAKTKPRYVVIENLNVKGMMKNRHLARSIAEQCFYTFQTWLIHKCKKYGMEVRQVSRFYPSSKMCSRCGHMKKDLQLSDRIYVCDGCGHTMDRDLHAATSLLRATDYIVLT